MKNLFNLVLGICSLAVVAPAFSAQDQLLLEHVHRSQKAKALAASTKAEKSDASAKKVDQDLKK